MYTLFSLIDMWFPISVELCSILVCFLGCILISIKMSTSKGHTLSDFVLLSIFLSKLCCCEEISTRSVLQFPETWGSPEIDRTDVDVIILLPGDIPVPMNRSHFIFAELLIYNL
jgi:hypothetical protein